jgi:hypothetical protein
MAFDLAERYVLEAENALGATLPGTYRVALMTNNGGTVDAVDEDWELIAIRDTSDKKRLARSCNDIVTETASFQEWSGFPAGAVAIAANGSGDCIVFLRVGDKFHPQPHIWSHETRAVVKISDDFSALGRHT